MKKDARTVLRMLALFIALSGDEVAFAFVIFLALPSLGIELPIELKLVTLGLLGAVSAVVYRALQPILKPPLVGAEAMIGATAITPLTPIGKITIWGEIWTAEMELGNAKLGEGVTIKKVMGLRLLVEKSA